MKAFKNRLRFARVRYYLLEYNISSLIKYFAGFKIGFTPSRRLNRYPGVVSEPSVHSCSKRLALFAAFHACDELPISNRLYLKALQSCRFRIIYIHNGPLDLDVQSLLGEFCERVFCRANVGQDMGAWKDGYLYLHDTHSLDQLEWLLMCNDSNFFVGGDRGLAFSEMLSNALDSDDSDLIALNKNYELWQHYQSFFLCYRRSLFASKKFYSFWLGYRPLDNRFHAINNGEIRLTRELLGAVRVKILYTSMDLVAKYDKLRRDSVYFYSFLPQNALYLAPKEEGVNSLDMLALLRILALLDQHNPSHVYALQFAYFLESPFLKKDVIRQGIFSMPQIYLYLKAIAAEKSLAALYQEIISVLQSGGTNVSFIRYLRTAVRRGINTHSKSYSGYGDAPEGLGLKGPS